MRFRDRALAEPAALATEVRALRSGLALDTLGEIAVLLIAALSAAVLLRRAGKPA